VSEHFHLVIVGAGPAGLSAAARAHERQIPYLLLERAARPADTVCCYQRRKPVMAEPEAIPLRSDLPFAAGSREAVLAAWDEAVAARRLALRTGCEVQRVEVQDGAPADRFRLHTNGGPVTAERLVLALGTRGNPRSLGVPGEDLPHVSYRLVDPAEHRGEEIVVVGAGDAALEVALALAADNRVHLVVRKPEIVRAKEVLEREVKKLAARGDLTIHYSTTVEAIEPATVALLGPAGQTRVAARRVFCLLGADPPRRFLEELGVRFTGAGPEARPVLDDTYQSTVAGLYLVGAVTGRDLIKLGLNQGYEVVEHLLGNPVLPADEEVLRQRLPHWPGTVRDRIRALREHIPLFQEAADPDLREALLATTVREARDGEVILRQNDYTDSLLILAAGRVAISARPLTAPGGTERPVATLEEGAFFGEMGLISGQRRTATARAVGPVRLLEIPRKAVLRLLAVAPGARRAVDRAFLVRAFQTYLFPGLPVEALADLVDRARLEETPRGTVVFREGDPGTAFYLIRSGMVKVSQGEAGRERVLTYLKAGSFFGEVALLPGSRRSATVTTIFPSDLIRLDRDAFQAFLEHHPELAPRFVEKLEERRVTALLAAATPGAEEIQSRLIDEEIVMGTDVLVIDDYKCVRCGNCVAACAGVHDDGQPRLTLTGVHFYNLLFPNSCWQCEDPLCMLDCPPDALVRDASGEIHIKSNCIGCGNCEANCPYGNIFMVRPEPRRGPFGFLARLAGGSREAARREVAVKCDLTSLPGGPACVRSCPTGAAMRLSRQEYEQSLAELLVRRGRTP
jgi:CRP-like cAMP-binding protein/thioredoxin reductase